MKSDLHCELQQKALTWLEGRATARGIRGSEEVCIAPGYVADAVAISGLGVKSEKLFVGTCDRRMGDKFSDDFAWVFESKVSRGDFFGTFKEGSNKHGGNRLEPIANFHMIVVPKNLITADEVPAFWGLLEKSGGGLALKKLPQYIDLSLESLHRVAYCILRETSYHNKFTIYSEHIDKFRAGQQQLDMELEII